MTKAKKKGDYDPGSFKDPEGRVCLVDDEVYRTLNPAATQRMAGLAKQGTLDGLTRKGLLIPSRLVTAKQARLDAAVYGKTLMHHDRIPLVCYPFEWSFSMLRDAALTTLSLLEECLEGDLILKDATAYNVALNRGKMVFFDTLSIEHYVPGTPWDGYAQFCREFLFPLLLAAHRGIEFQPWFRGSLNGIGVSDAARLFGWGDMFKGGVLRHVMLQARLEQSFAGKDVKVRENFGNSTFSKELILSNLRGLRRLIEKLRYRTGSSEWISYTAENTYSDEASRSKAEFVEKALQKIAPKRVTDFGCNTGDYSLIAGERAKLVAALDIDAACIDALYLRLKAGNVTNVVPMVANLLNPSPGLGWGLNERRDLFARVGGDAFLALALVHHICIGGNVPMEAFLDQLRRIAPAGVVEWVGKDDAMVQRMLRNRKDVFDGYEWQRFHTLLRERFTVAEISESHAGTRKMCLLLPKK